MWAALAMPARPAHCDQNIIIAVKTALPAGLGKKLMGRETGRGERERVNRIVGFTDD